MYWTPDEAEYFLSQMAKMYGVDTPEELREQYPEIYAMFTEPDGFDGSRDADLAAMA